MSMIEKNGTEGENDLERDLEVWHFLSQDVVRKSRSFLELNDENVQDTELSTGSCFFTSSRAFKMMNTLLRL